uniref:EF-hand domain-containing protein n=1 Tax=Pseudictyota dubia TaxID=2749911 RepID=A0A7R9W6E1_9STRA|mmetsp:Transcript_35896/g.66115  ORF Transcript_35896/g.66115 Transcript_35896/m.66115 type:complete len:1130 (+) Transcript_35896:1200-4589(+)
MFATHGITAQILDESSEEVVPPDNEVEAATAIQSAFRSYSTRKYLFSCGVDPTAGPHDRRQKDVAAYRVFIDLGNRRKYERRDGIETRRRRREMVMDALDRQLERLNGWKNARTQAMASIQSTASKQRTTMEALHEDLARCSPDSDELRDLTLQLKEMRTRLAHSQYLEGSFERRIKRTEEQRKFFVRMRAKTAALSSRCDSFLEDSDRRVRAATELMPAIHSQLDRLSSIEKEESASLPHCERWLREQLAEFNASLAKCDAVVGKVLSEETDRLKDEFSTAVQADEILRSFLRSTVTDAQLQSEKVGCELLATTAAATSGRLGEQRNDVREEEDKLTRLRWIEVASRRSLAERRRCQVLRKDLDAFYRRKGRDMESAVDFLDDGGEKGSIRAVPRRDHRPALGPDAQSVTEWKDTFLNQPWLEGRCSEEALAEARRRARRRHLEGRLGESDRDQSRLDRDRVRAGEAEAALSRLLRQAEEEGTSAFVRKELRAKAHGIQVVYDTFRGTEESRAEGIAREEAQVRAELSQLDREDDVARQGTEKQKEELDVFLSIMVPEDDDKTKLTCMKRDVEERLQKFEKKREKILVREDMRQRRERLLKAKANKENASSSCSTTTHSSIDWSVLDELEKEERKRKMLRAVPLQPPASSNLPGLITPIVTAARSPISFAKKAIGALPRRGGGRRSAERRDREVTQMMTTVRRSMARQSRKIVAVSDVRLTAGKAETEDFASVNLELQAKGKPYFRRVKRGIGSTDQVVIWLKRGTEQTEFLTELVLGHMSPGHEHFFNGHTMGMALTVHDRMRGTKKDDPCLAFWTKRDERNSRVISDMNVSYTREDRRELAKEGYETVRPNLSTFGLAESFLHIKYEDRPNKPQMTDVTHMTKELQDYSAMLSKNPTDPILKNMVEETQRRLRALQIDEESRTRCTSTDPVEYTMDFLALDGTEIAKLRAVYDKIDKDNDGFIAVEEFAYFLSEPRTMLPYFRHIFTITEGSIPEDDKLSFGVTVKGIAMFCMLSPREALQFIFSLKDSRGRGVIPNSEFLELVSMFHPQHRGRALRALREFDLPSDSTMTFTMFRTLHETFPHLMYPALRAQETTMKMFLGVKFWEHKLRKYMTAKEKVKQEQSS